MAAPPQKHRLPLNGLQMLLMLRVRGARPLPARAAGKDWFLGVAADGAIPASLRAVSSDR